MQVFVVSPFNQRECVDVQEDETFGSLKETVLGLWKNLKGSAKCKSLCIDLTYGGVVCPDEELLSRSGIEPDDEVHVVPSAASAIALLEDSRLNDLPPWAQQHRDVVLAAVQRHGDDLRSASEELREDHEVVLAAVTQCGIALRGVAEDSPLRDDLSIVRVAVGNDPTCLAFASERLRNQVDFVQPLLVQEGGALLHAGPSVRDCRPAVLSAVKKCGYALQYASPRIRNDREVVLTAVKSSSSAIEHVGDALKTDHDFLISAIQTNDMVYSRLGCICATLQDDIGLILKALDVQNARKTSVRSAHDTSHLVYAGPQAANNRDVVMKAVMYDRHALHYAPDHMKVDPEMVYAAIFCQASKDYNNAILRLAQWPAMGRTPSEIRMVHAALASRPDILAAALQHNWTALKAATPAVRNHPDVVEAARRYVTRNSHSRDDVKKYVPAI